MPGGEQLFNRREAAKMLGISVPELNRLRHTGKGPKCRPKEGKLFYSVEELQKWLGRRADQKGKAGWSRPAARPALPVFENAFQSPRGD